MKFSKKRILNPRRYLYALQPGDKFYLASRLSEEDEQRLLRYGIKPDGKLRIPSQKGRATSVNANGKWIVCRELPKKERPFVHPYHVIDWHGNDHYGTCVQYRMCYQRKLIAPANCAFMVENDVLFSEMMENSESSLEATRIAMNVMLELVGHFEIWTADKAPVLPSMKQYEVPWEILRPGVKTQEEIGGYVVKVVKRQPRAYQEEIYNRHLHMLKLQPDFIVLGTQNFFGYVVYGFLKYDLFLFESCKINNATYAFRGDWEQASRLTKTEVLTGGIHEARIFHTEQWKNRLSNLVTRFEKTVG